MEVSGQIHATAAFPQGKNPYYPFDRRLRGLQSRSGFGGEEKHFHLLPGLEPPSIQSVAQFHTIELAWLPKGKLKVKLKLSCD
jgi:hypothetical protein